MSGGQQHSPYNHNPSPSLPYRTSFSPTEQLHPLQNPAVQFPNPTLHSHSHPHPHLAHQQFATNGHSSSLPLLSTPGTNYPTRSGYYDPVDRPSDMNSAWGHSTYDRRPSVQSQPVGILCSLFSRPRFFGQLRAQLHHLVLTCITAAS